MLRFEKANQSLLTNTAEKAPNSEDNVHLLPFHFPKDTTAKVEDFFASNIREENVYATDGSVLETNLKTSLHGRDMKGKDVHIPENYAGS